MAQAGVVDVVNNVGEIFGDDDDEEIIEVINALARGPRNFRERPDHLNQWNDKEFSARFRLSKDTVLHLLEELEPLIRSRTDRNHAVSPLNKLLLTLRFYALGTMLSSVGDFVGVSKATASRIIKEVTFGIASLRPVYIRMPSTEQEIRNAQTNFYEMAQFPKVIGAIDCTHVRLQSPGGQNAEYFRNRKGYFSLNVQTVSDAHLKICDIVARWPGATHDQTVFNNSNLCHQFENGNFRSGILLGDSGYENRVYLLTPLLHPETPAENRYNEAHIRTRNVVERQYGVLKRRFPILSLGMRLSLPVAQAVVVAVAILHNIALDAAEEQPPDDPDLVQKVPQDHQWNDEAAVMAGNDILRRNLINNFFLNLR
ncbi:putative nuclease HARBI1 isoform X1 [Bacillus rossius redtenbacheri]|uniref:putative nuclease HARBI1 isoform X1 n=1 Tax=Bacillus rossius redtenbacheri TaxID=93214 RepID=UPI002FDEA05C